MLELIEHATSGQYTAPRSLTTAHRDTLQGAQRAKEWRVFTRTHNNITMKLYETTMTDALHALQIADAAVKNAARYSCGLEYDSIQTRKNGSVRAFFNSPDYQNEQLYTELRKLKWMRSFYNAPYHWAVRRGDVFISYTEGDIDVYSAEQQRTAQRTQQEAETDHGTCHHCGHPLDERGLCTAPLSVAD